MKRKVAVAYIIFVTLSMLACGSLPSLPGVGAQPTSLSELWPDVPKMDGLTLAPDLQAPTWVHVVLTLVTKQILGGGTDQGDWIDFTTAKTPDDVKTFYTPQVMAAAGWDPSDKSTCVAGADQGVPQVGQVCFFIKTGTGQLAGHNTGLIIVAAEDSSSKQTNVFFVRVETVDMTPTPAK